MKPIVIIGAGISGLTAGYALKKAGRDVIIVERSSGPGGLARSLDLDGCIYDIGPHYFFLKTDPRADALVKECLGDEALVFDFQVSVLYRGSNLAWPPNMKSLFKLPMSSIVTTVKNSIRRRFPEDKDCRGFMSGFYGERMYQDFLGPYLEKKVPQLMPDKLHREWWLQVARTIHNQYPGKGGDKVKRIEAMKKVPLTDRAKVMLRMLNGFVNTALGKNLRKVLYPKGGMGKLCDALADGFLRMGGSIEYDVADVRLETGDNRIKSVTFGDRKIEDPRTLIWTGSIHELAGQIDIETPDLPLIDIVLGFVRTNRSLPLPHYLYTYYAQPDIIFNRAYFPRLIESGLVPDGKDAICVEISPKGDNANSLDEDSCKRDIITGLERVGLCTPGDIEDISMMNVREAYPIYPLDYYEKLQSVWAELKRYDNLFSIGRSAQFYYNNMARAMGVGLDLAEHLTETN